MYEREGNVCAHEETYRNDENSAVPNNKKNYSFKNSLHDQCMVSYNVATHSNEMNKQPPPRAVQMISQRNN